MRWIAWWVVAGLISACCIPFGDNEDETETASATAPATAAGPAAIMPTVAETAQPQHPAIVATHLARLTAELPCDQPTTPAALAPFCHLAGWNAGTAAALPDGALVGVTSFVVTTGPVQTNLAQQVKLSVLAVRHVSGQAFADITSPGGRPGDPIPAQAAQSVLGTLQRNDPGPILLPGGLFGFYTGRAGAAQYPIGRAGTGWQAQGGSFADIRRVDNHWVAVEIPQNNPAGIYVSVFADNLVRGQ